MAPDSLQISLAPRGARRAVGAAQLKRRKGTKMIRNLKALGLGLAAAFALSALGASAAQAQEGDHMQCGNGEGTCTVKVVTDPDKKNQKFTTKVGAVECKTFNAEYKGDKTINEDATLEEVEYGSCTVGGAVPASVNFGSCDYTLNAPLDTVEGHGQGDVTIGPGGCSVTISVSAPFECTITVPGGQTFENAITYTEVETEGNKEITGHASTNTINYSWSGPACGSGSDSAGKYEGTFTASAWNTAETEQTDLTIVEG